MTDLQTAPYSYSVESRLRPRAAAGGPDADLRWTESEAGWESAEARGIFYLIRREEACGGRVLSISARTGETDWEPVISRLFPQYRTPGQNAVGPWYPDYGSTLIDFSVAPCEEGLRARMTEQYAGREMEFSWTFRIHGAALEIEAASPVSGGMAGYAGVFCDLEHSTHRQVMIPGLPDPLLVTACGNFASAFADRYRGAATAYGVTTSLYALCSGGRGRPLNDYFWASYSSDPLDPLPALRRPSSHHRADLLERVTVDYYSDCSFLEDEKVLRKLHLYGLHDVYLIYRNWQHYGYRRRGPLQFPADPERGGSDDFRRVCAAVREAGWLLALREEYANIMPDSPYWDEEVLARSATGEGRQSPASRRPAVAADKMLDFARLEAPDIQRNYAPDGTFVDGHTSWNPEGGFAQVDLGPGSRCLAESAAIAEAEKLYAFLSSVRSGPVIGAAGAGPARFDTFAAGGVDAIIRGADGGLESPLVVDYELNEVLPSLLGIGAGSYRQFCGFTAGKPVGAEQVDWDAYRATEIALGHAGYVGNYGIRTSSRNIPFPGGSAATAVREYFLLRALQALYLGSPVAEILYRHGEEMLPLASALRCELDLANVQIHIRYMGGLQIWVNRHARDEWNVKTESGSFLLPASGFLALAPRQKLTAYSAICNGFRTDYCTSNSYTFLDTRGTEMRGVGDLQVDGAVCLFRGESPRRADVVLVNATRLRVGEQEYRISQRGDLRLAHRSLRELEVTLLDLKEGSAAHVTLPEWDPGWGRGTFEVSELRADGWHPSDVQVEHTRVGPQIMQARQGVTYRIRTRS